LSSGKQELGNYFFLRVNTFPFYFVKLFIIHLKIDKKMKKLVITVLAITAIEFSTFAQPGGGFQRRTPEEQAAAIHLKLDSAFKLEPAKLATLDTALTALFKAQNTRMQEIFASGERPDRETMMAERKKYTDARDEMIKAMVTADQFAVWKDQIEPSMRPQRFQGGGGNSNRNNQQ
jgi:hypothetical protein